MFQIWNCEGGFTYNGVNYKFKDLDGVVPSKEALEKCGINMKNIQSF